ncbi:ABC transporter ATP-binding protein [Pigmentiphaga soli]|uniref:ABC transporter ATP-binding protein n=1 Tax=Pigmentiphaga soli TaxID=1007095 RepID=A0ABP8GGF7_9BURK
MSTSTGYIECAAVRKIYGDGGQGFEALRSVSFTIRDGEFVALLGPSGCGKSTLLMMIGGLEDVTAGSIRVGGAPVDGPRPDTGVMFQDPTLLPWKTALENVLFPIRMMRQDVSAYEPAARELLRMAGLAAAVDKKPRQLSGGMRQRVALCRALVHRPRLLLMDEPFSALDAITRDEMGVALLELWERYKQTAIFVTHSIREAVFLADRVLVMGGRPSSIVADIRIPFARPRAFAVNESAEFNEICAYLREQIKESPAAMA